MGDNKISEAAVEAACSTSGITSRAAMRAALDAAFTHLHPQPAELAFDVQVMLAACVPGGSIVDPQVVADNIRAWFADQKPAELAEQQGVSLPPFPRTHYNACGDSSEPLYTAEQMQDYARAALAARQYESP